MLQRLIDLFTKEPSAEWPECRRVPLSLYLPYESLNNIALGDHYQKLSVFGRPSNTNPFKYNRFIYYPLGLIIEGANERVEYFEFIVQDEYEKKHTPCVVTITSMNGGSVEINQETHLTKVERLFGKSEDKEEEEDEIICRYKQGKLLLEFECSSEAFVRRLHVERWDSA
jgi:hypothetical protein